MNKLEARKQYDSLIFLGNQLHKIKDQFSREMIHLAFKLLLLRSRKLLARMNEHAKKTNSPVIRQRVRRFRVLDKQIRSIEATADVLCIPKMRRALLKEFEQTSK
ncbi:hypothetical protein [Leptospira noguchii]|uniref:hypothetical protein n=1 Tax=Leptospira noguchii TaxID=28182 RepID=UPI0011473333|nr:hypothetical protein [Leptospira noguchii]TQE67243.1 hypothetical protein FF021_17855 [Leptospira noguchii]UOG28951.1 hypothetical protein MAL06_09465 [Leptospira noguchii]UOG51085.1 hypothetical protein MAL09_10065 [Leptospira noguchii]